MLLNGTAQVDLKLFAYVGTGIDPREVAYIEAYSTSIVASNKIEIKAITKVFVNNRESPLHVSSIKLNIGYLEAASRLAGLIKAVLILEKGLIPLNTDFKEEKPGL